MACSANFELGNIPWNNSLCDICKALDLKKIFQTDVRRELGTFIADLKSSFSELKKSKCALCQLFGSLAPVDFAETGRTDGETCHIRAFSARLVFTGLRLRETNGFSDNALLGIVRERIGDANSGRNNASYHMNDSLSGTGYLCSTQTYPKRPILGVREISRTSFDIDFVTACLNKCTINHGSNCQSQNSNDLRNLRVMDCRTRITVSAPTGCQYVALSYVWGPQEPTETLYNTSGSQPVFNSLPKVVEDSCIVTAALGYRYIWVDKYCIDQADEQDKHSQVRQMDLIYTNAQMTIIAAAGEDCSHGLPGVRDTMRRGQPKLNVGSFSIVSTMSRPIWLMRKAKWNTRGWTYQEGLLSQRRVIFTDQQVFFECNGMHCAESMVQPLDLMHAKHMRKFRSCIPHGAFRFKTPAANPWEIMSYLSEYNTRELTFPADTINAFEGIFGLCSRASQPLYHFMGIPIFSPLARSRKPVNGDPRACFLVGLTWSHTEPSRRRPLFPSWTWAGWHGNLAHYFNFSVSSVDRLDTVGVFVEEDDQSLTSFPAFEALPEFLLRRTRSNYCILLDSRVTQLSIVYLNKSFIMANLASPYKGRLDLSAEDGTYAKFQRDKGTSMYIRVYLDDEEDLKQIKLGQDNDTYSGIIFGEGEGEFDSIVVLVVKETGKHAERKGLLTTGMWSILQEKQGLWEAVTLGWYTKEYLLGSSSRRLIRLA